MKKAIPIVSFLVILAVIFGRAYFAESDSRRLDGISQIYLEGDLEGSLAKMVEYLKDYPKDDLAWTIKGNILAEQDADDEAEAAYLKALELNPKNFQATNAMGVLFRKKGDPEQAMTYYRKAIELEPGYAQAYSSMAVIELKRSNDVEALRLAKKAYENDKEDPVIVSNLAVAYHYKGLEKERDQFTDIAEGLGYDSIDVLKKIYSGELTVRDE